MTKKLNESVSNCNNDDFYPCLDYFFKFTHKSDFFLTYINCEVTTKVVRYTAQT